MQPSQASAVPRGAVVCPVWPTQRGMLAGTSAAPGQAAARLGAQFEGAASPPGNFPQLPRFCPNRPGAVLRFFNFAFFAFLKSNKKQSRKERNLKRSTDRSRVE